MAYYVFLPLALIFSFFFCLQRRKGYNLNNLFLKTISSIGFVFTAILAMIENPNAKIFGLFVIFGGVLGMLGDIFLDLKGIYINYADKYLNSGFMFFLIGHIFYSTTIIVQSKMQWWMCIICVALAIGTSVGNYFISEKALKLDFGKFAKIVSTYVAFMSLTMYLAFAALIMSKFKSVEYILLSIGATLFTLSDAVLSGTYFGKGKDRPIDYFVNHFLYYGGQYLIASSVLFM